MNVSDVSSHVDLSWKNKMETDYSPVRGFERINQRRRNRSLKCTSRGCHGPDPLPRIPYFSPLHEHGGLHCPVHGQGRDWDDQERSREQDQGLNSLKSHQQETAVMQNKLFCVSTAVTVRRARTSHLHERPPPRACGVFEGRFLEAAADGNMWLSEMLLKRRRIYFPFQL